MLLWLAWLLGRVTWGRISVAEVPLQAASIFYLMNEKIDFTQRVPIVVYC